MNNVVTDVFEQIKNIPSDLGQKAVEQIKGGGKPADDQLMQEEKAKAQAAKRRLPALTERDYKIAARKIEEVRQQMKEEEQKKKMVEQQMEQKKKAEMPLGQKLAAQGQAETRGGAGGIG